jgi:molybdopterin-containing oxidoreductase family membrane subunit
MSVAPSEIAVSRGSPVLAEGHTFATVTDQVTDVVLRRPPGIPWRIGVVITAFLVMVLVTAVSYLFGRGVGIWGIDIPVAWGFAIVNFVWWIGIGHAGTFISAFLLLLKQDWRTSINRFAEAMTLFAVACAGLFPLLHLGRPWEFFWLFPYPNSMWLWPQFRSPLIWDVFAVSTYATISLVFWFVGLIPDLATLRDRTASRTGQFIYGALAMGWRGSARHWHRYQTAYLLLAGLAAPLVVSVHSVVGMDFAAAQVPGWHSTIFPPYFVAGAIFSGFAMVITLAIPLRWAFKLEDFITIRHLENCGKLMLITGLIVAYGYASELFFGWLGGDEYEMYMNLNRMAGHYMACYWTLMFCNVLTPQLLWFRSVRRSVPLLFLISLVVQVGMWMERFVIIITSLQRDFLPSSWGMYYPTFWDWATLLGTIGFFTFCFLLFAKLLPVISIFELREMVEDQSKTKKRHAA